MVTDTFTKPKQEQTDNCPKCGQPLREGELITGQAWNGDGGEHVDCKGGQQ